MDRSWHRKHGVLAAVLAMILLLGSACQAAPPTAVPTPGVAVPAPVAAATATPTPVVPEGALRIAVPGFPQVSNDPVNQSPGGNGFVYELLYDPLVGTTADGSALAADLGVAESWEISPDNSRYTFHLREGIPFHDGWGNITAEDVKFSIERQTQKGVSGTATELAKAVKSVETPDAKTVVVTLKNPSFAPFFWLTKLGGDWNSYIVPKARLAKEGDVEFALKGSGSGPYKFAEKDPGNSMRVTALPKHWAFGVPKWKDVFNIKVPEETTRIALLKSGQIDVAAVSKDNIQEVRKAGFEVYSKSEAMVVDILLYGQQREPGCLFSDVRVRKAIALSINRQEMVNRLLAGQGEPIGSLIGSWDPGYVKLDPYPYDPAQARSLLEAAGKVGAPVQIAAADYGWLADSRTLSEALADYLRKVGLNPSLETGDYGQFRTKMLNKAMGCKFLMFPFPSRQLWASGILIFIASDGGLTTASYPEVDNWANKVRKAVKQSDYAEAMGGLQRINYEQYVVVPVMSVAVPYAVNPKRVTSWGIKNDKMLNGIALMDLVVRR